MLLGFTTLTHAALLVSNTGQGTVSGSQFDLANSRGQSFTTGPSARGYEVDSVEVDVSSSGNGNMTVALRESASNGKPGTLVCALNGPSSLGTGNQQFTAPAGACSKLESATDYFVVASTSQPPNAPSLSVTGSLLEDSASFGWTIGDVSHMHESWSDTTLANLLRIRVNGETANEAPTTSSGEVTATEDVEFAFTENHFSYMDDDGDALGHVKITSLGGQGTLFLDGAAVTLDEQVSKADLDGGKLTYTAPVNANGNDFTTFDFKVNDGREDSAEYTLTIDVTAANDPPVVSGPESPEYLEGATSRITYQVADPDGDVVTWSVSGWADSRRGATVVESGAAPGTGTGSLHHSTSAGRPIGGGGRLWPGGVCGPGAGDAVCPALTGWRGQAAIPGGQPTGAAVGAATEPGRDAPGHP